MRGLLSVGIDLGTTTTQVLLSRLTVENEAGAFSVPHYVIGKKEVLYKSPVAFTPLLSPRVLDGPGIRALVERAYREAGVAPEDIETGAVIITGETARKENAGAVLEALSGFAGDFVVATAGPDLESVLAGKGAGAPELSREKGRTVLNLDIGGGTTNFAAFTEGQVTDTGCLNVGGRLIKVDGNRVITYISPVLASHTSLKVGQAVEPRELEPVICLLRDALVDAVLGGEAHRPFITHRAPAPHPEALLTFSGGVADLMEPPWQEDPFAFGDLGVLLGRSLAASPLRAPGKFLPARETIRATVLGAGCHTTELSGSTIFYTGAVFPLKNLPVVTLLPREEGLEPEVLGPLIRQRMELLAPQGAGVLGLQGRKNPRFSELCKLADGIAAGLAPLARDGRALVVAAEADMGQALGQALGMLLPGVPLICLDGIHLPGDSYLDIGAPVAGGRVLPVVVKTLVL